MDPKNKGEQGSKDLNKQRDIVDKAGKVPSSGMQGGGGGGTQGTNKGGFGAMDDLARKGTAGTDKTAQFTSEESREAGRQGGEPGKQVRGQVPDIGKKGDEHNRGNR